MLVAHNDILKNPNLEKTHDIIRVLLCFFKILGFLQTLGLTLPNVRNVGSDISDSVRSVRPFISNHTFFTQHA